MWNHYPISHVLTGRDNKEREGDGVEEVAGHDLLWSYAESSALLKVFLSRAMLLRTLLMPFT
jgi:hypothetical protein